MVELRWCGVGDDRRRSAVDGQATWGIAAPRPVSAATDERRRLILEAEASVALVSQRRARRQVGLKFVGRDLGDAVGQHAVCHVRRSRAGQRLAQLMMRSHGSVSSNDRRGSNGAKLAFQIEAKA